MSDLSRVVCPYCGVLNRVAPDRPASAARCGGCKQALFTGHPTEVDEAAFDRHVRSNSLPVLVDIWAPWCGPCRSMAPQYERAAATLEPGVRLLKLNADSAPSVSAGLGVRGIPALFLFRDGRVLAQTSGAMAEDAIVRWTRDHIGP